MRYNRGNRPRCRRMLRWKRRPYLKKSSSAADLTFLSGAGGCDKFNLDKSFIPSFSGSGIVCLCAACLTASSSVELASCALTLQKAPANTATKAPTISRWTMASILGSLLCCQIRRSDRSGGSNLRKLQDRGPVTAAGIYRLLGNHDHISGPQHGVERIA